MNEILQQRIEEAARNEREQCREDNNEIWRGNPTYNDVEASFIKGATFVLQNQWISVEEALPEIKEHFVSEDVLCIYSDGQMGFSRLKENLFGQNGFEYESEESVVTHWMPIPSLKGGE